jgi:hypothetical protein
MCTQCHGFENVVGARVTKEPWGDIVDDIGLCGAVGTEDEIDQVVNYLAGHFGKSDARKVDVIRQPPPSWGGAVYFHPHR